jgi:hypothetical protein
MMNISEKGFKRRFLLRPPLTYLQQLMNLLVRLKAIESQGDSTYPCPKLNSANIESALCLTFQARCGYTR